MIQQFKPLSLDELCERLVENKKTLIAYHIRPDADAVGSAFALRQILHELGIPAYCVCSDEIPERLRFIADGVQGSVLLEDGLPIDYQRVISVDSAAPAQLGEVFIRLHKDIDIMIDHHASGTPYAENYIDASASATGEIIYELAQRLVEKGLLECISDRVKNCVYAAISADTGGFRFSNATPKALRIAAALVESGVDSSEINRLLFDSKPIEQLKAEGEAISRLRLHRGGRVASTLFPYYLRADLGLSEEDLGTLVDIPRSVLGVEIAFCIKEDRGGAFRASLRSATDFDVAAVCTLFGGGGHKRAAGCTVPAGTIEEAERKILDAIYRKM